MKISYMSFDNETQAAEKPLLEKIIRLIAPHWVLEFIVCGPGSANTTHVKDGGGAASCEVRADYFKAWLHLPDQFFTMSYDDKVRTAVHEVAHCYTVPQYSACMDLISEEEANKIRNTQSRWLEFANTALEEKFMQILFPKLALNAASEVVK